MKLINNNFSYVLGNGIGVTGLNAAFYFIFAALLSPEDYGYLSYLIAIAGTASIISQFGFPTSVTVFQSKGNLILSNQINVIAIITTIVASIILLSINITAAILSLSVSFFIMNQHNLLGLKKYKTFFWTGLLKGIFIVTLPILFYTIFDIPGIVLGMALSNLLCSFNFLKKINFNINNFCELKPTLKFIFHNFSIQASSGFAKFLDKLIIVPLVGFTFVGLYQFNLQILLALTILPASLHSYLLSEESSGNNHTRINYLVILTSILLVITSFVISPFVVDNLFPKYSEGVPSLQIILISLIPISISSIINPKLQAIESILVGYPAIARIASLIIFLIVFGSLWGLLGLSLSILLSSTIESIFLIILYIKKIKHAVN